MVYDYTCKDPLSDQTLYQFVFYLNVFIFLNLWILMYNPETFQYSNFVVKKEKTFELMQSTRKDENRMKMSEASVGDVSADSWCHGVYVLMYMRLFLFVYLSMFLSVSSLGMLNLTFDQTFLGRHMETTSSTWFVVVKCSYQLFLGYKQPVIVKNVKIERDFDQSQLFLLSYIHQS